MSIAAVAGMMIGAGIYWVIDLANLHPWGSWYIALWLLITGVLLGICAITLDD